MITREDIATALEWRSEGVQWAYIAIGLGVSESAIVSAVHQATKVHDETPEYPASKAP